MLRVRVVAAVVACFGLATLAQADREEKPKKAKRPALELRASPRTGFSPVDVLFTAELKGGDEAEAFYCPEVEWEWGDGGRSVSEADCEPWAAGSTIARRFSEHHSFPLAGLYRVKVTLKKSGGQIASQSVDVTVHAGVGDLSPDP